MKPASASVAFVLVVFLSGRPIPAQEAALTTPESVDVLIRGGTIIDGSGKPGFAGDVAILGGLIHKLGENLEISAPEVIDARGLVVAPGFIDLHSHSDTPLLEDKKRQNLSYILQGCTTVVTGNCGSGHVDTAKYFAALEKNGAGTNVFHLLPHGSAREQAMNGSFDRPPTAEEMETLKRLIRRAMEDGAVGMSTGLIYTPGSYATTEELIECAKVVAEFDGLYASHIRGEGDRLLQAIDEAITIGEKSGCTVQISHFKCVGPKNRGKIREAAAKIVAARERGVRVFADQYPYTASSTSLRALTIDTRFREGSENEFRARLRDPEVGPKIRADIVRQLEDRGGAETLLIARHRADPELNGRKLSEIAKARGQEPADVVLDIEEKGGAQAIAFGMNEDDVSWAMTLDWVATASDGSSMLPDDSRPHPRSYGTFPRKIGRYSLERKILSLEAAVRSASGLPADILRRTDRGYLRSGAAADLVVFDPESFRDDATYADPHRFALGARWVFVNGAVIVKNGTATGQLKGRVLRR